MALCSVIKPVMAVWCGVFIVQYDKVEYGMGYLQYDIVWYGWIGLPSSLATPDRS